MRPECILRIPTVGDLRVVGDAETIAAALDQARRTGESLEVQVLDIGKGRPRAGDEPRRAWVNPQIVVAVIES